VKYAIRATQIEDLGGVITKVKKMKEIMIETNVDPKIILGKVQRHMDNLTIANQGTSTSRNVEKRGIGGGVFQGIVPNVRNDPTPTQETKQRVEIVQMNRTIRQMKNELTRFRRVENFVPVDQNP
jgi:hypothetical protein